LIFGKKTYTLEDIIIGCIANERRHQELLYRKFFDTIFAMCRKHLINEEDALSVLNAGFLKVFQKIHTFENRGSLEGWIRRIVYHTMIEHLRGQKRYKTHIVFDEPKGVSFKGNIMDELLLEDIMKLLVKVPNMSRKVFKLYAIEGYNHREIGELLSINENTSKWHLSNARRVLQIELQKVHLVKNSTN
jgi:RNA polymerase sigma factor (sigma-70 family)